MKIIYPKDADERTTMAALEQRAKEANQFLNDYESVMKSGREFMARCGATPMQVEQVHPGQYAHDVLAEYGRSKLES